MRFCNALSVYGRCYDEDSVSDLCRICEKRRPRRYCAGVHGDICAICCGEQREITVDCPLDCEYLIEARRHEKIPELQPADMPNQDIRIPESFLREHEQLLMAAAGILFEAAVETQGAIDYDVREALESLIKTYKTLGAGLIYESRPTNPIAASIQRIFEERMRAIRDELTQRAGMTVVRDAEVLGILAFLQRLEIQHNNGKRRGRAFIDMLRSFLPPPRPATASNLVIG